MSDRFPIFDVVLERRRRRWVWSVRTTEGMMVITGSRSSRSAARYEAHRALFLMLLSAPYRSRTSGREIQASQASAQRSLPEVRSAAAEPAIPSVAIWSCAKFEEDLRVGAEWLLRCWVEGVPFPDSEGGASQLRRKVSGRRRTSACNAGRPHRERTAFRMPCCKRAIFPHFRFGACGARCMGVLSRKALSQS